MIHVKMFICFVMQPRTIRAIIKRAPIRIISKGKDIHNVKRVKANMFIDGMRPHTSSLLDVIIRCIALIADQDAHLLFK